MFKISKTLTVSLCLVAALVLVARPAQAQGKGGNATEARIAALEAAVAKLQGNITSADLVGTYRLAALATDLDGGPPASVTMFAYGAIATLAANGTGIIAQGGGPSGAIELVEGTPWTDSATLLSGEGPTNITWSYANGLLHLSDGTENLDIQMAVGAGGRMLTWAGLSDDNTADIIIGTRLQ
jgi:hypothetical protein